LFGNLARKTQSPSVPRDEALLLMQTFEESGQGWFWSINAAGQLVYISESVAQLLGATAEKLIGQRFVDLFVSQEDSSGRRNLPFLLTRASAFDGVTLIPASGDVERFWLASGRPQFDRAGTFIGFRGSAIGAEHHHRARAP
jgi:PAS domain S-box-containing protein